jgi:SAM-dependent methyltransferase
MATTAERFREFWADKTSPMSRCDNPQSRRLLAKELRLLFGERDPVSVLEIGCGNGCLFDSLDFSPRFYRGVDFAPRMLEIFRDTHPQLDLVLAEASSYVDARTYDLILAHDVIAHFSLSMLARHCSNARRMMHSESLLVWASIPWRPLRNSYDFGRWFNTGNASLLRWGKSRIRRMLGRDLMGRWYTTAEIIKVARQNSLRSRFHGSITHPYRFHAVLSLASSSRNAGCGGTVGNTSGPG